MGPCLGPREHLLWHATFCNCRPLDDHPAAVEDRVGHVALRARPSRAPAVDATAVAPISSCKPCVAPSPSSSTSLLEADQALARDADDGLLVRANQPGVRRRGRALPRALADHVEGEAFARRLLDH